MTTDLQNKLKLASQPLMELLATPDFHPHITVQVTSEDTIVMEGLLTLTRSNLLQETESTSQG